MRRLRRIEARQRNTSGVRSSVEHFVSANGMIFDQQTQKRVLLAPISAISSVRDIGRFSKYLFKYFFEIRN